MSSQTRSPKYDRRFNSALNPNSSDLPLNVDLFENLDSPERVRIQPQKMVVDSGFAEDDAEI